MPTCRSCGATIRWAKTKASGALIPIDADAVADGNVVIEDGVADVLGTSALEKLPAGTPRYRSHFATCVNAKQHRQR